MPSLADLQARIVRVVAGASVGEVEGLVGGVDPARRLLIHRRHYEASLSTALREKFPATAWLVGERFVGAVAREFLRVHPPLRPCIAEYGAEFPAFLARFGGAVELPYLRAFAELEWALGQVSVAIEEAPLTWPDMSRLGAGLLEARLDLQPGVRYLRSRWNVDTLMTRYLEDDVRNRFELIERDTLIEVRGARGDFRIERLEATTFAFREALAAGRAFADAASDALDLDDTFDAGDALRTLVQSGLLVRTTMITEEIDE